VSAHHPAMAVLAIALATPTTPSSP